ncbi:MAG: hypothetical protein K1060chlam5_00892 [Candidatus Anoxychlamydiales bacterium]|nr:hypothetical protein [Candidatus Anoxychlamydiales bacterium]
MRYLVFFILLAFSLNAKIIEIKNIKDIKPYITKDTLVIFDLDNTIMEPIQEYGSDQWFAYQLNKYLKEKLSFEDALQKTLYEWFEIQAITKVKLVENDVKDLISNLQEINHPIMGLTARDYDFALAAIKQLKSLNLNLSKTAPFKKNIFDDTLFREGILFANGKNKGIVLSNFFKKIIYIDDKKHHVEEIEIFSKENKVEFIGFRYGYLDEKVKKFDHKISDKQKRDFSNFICNDKLILE